MCLKFVNVIRSFFLFFVLTFSLSFNIVIGSAHAAQADKDTIALPNGFPSEAFWYDGKWAFEHSDLPRDPKIKYGTLKNGFRYAIVPHKQSQNRVSLYLVVQAGSLMETEEELGYAHYVEHMAFNGSKNFPAGSLIPFFQKNGMSFGGDTNAHTSLMETVYKLNIAENTKESWKDALLVLRDFSDGLLFEEKEVKEELGVIMSEKKDRDSEEALNRLKRQAFLYPQTKFSNPVIGTEETLNAVTAEKLRNFYTKWYTPDRMVLVVVGDIDKKQFEPMIETIFGSIKVNKEKTLVSAWGDPKNQGLRFLAEKRPIEGANVSIMLHFPRVHQHDSLKYQKELYINSLIEYALQRRFQIITQENPHLWNAVRFMNARSFGLLPSCFFTAITNQDDWKNAIIAGGEEIRRMGEYGLTVEELKQGHIFMQNSVKRFKQQYPNLENHQIADHFVVTLNADRVYTSLDFDSELIEKFKKEITLKEVNEIAKKTFSTPDLTVVVSSAQDIKENAIKEVWEKVQKIQLTPFKGMKQAEFPYLALPAKIDEKKLAKLNTKEIAKVKEHILTTYTTILPNKAEFHAFPLPFSPNKVQITLLFGKGYAGLDDKQIGLAQFSNMIMRGSGLGKLSLDDTNILGEKWGGYVQESYGMNDRSISIEGDSSSFESLMQAVWTQYRDPMPTENALIRAKGIIKKQTFIQNNSVDGATKTKGASFFFGDARRYQSIVYPEIAHVTLKEIQDIVLQDRYNGQIKIIVSGDIDPNKAYSVAMRYFGQQTMNVKEIKEEIKPLVFPKNKSVYLEIPDVVDQAVVLCAWHKDTKDIYDRKKVATRQLASSLLRDKLREEIREKMGAAYSPFAMYRSLPTEKGFGLLQLTIKTDIAHLEEVTNYVNNMKAWEVKQEDLDRLRLPMITAWKTSRANNAKWSRLFYAEVSQNYPYMEWDTMFEKELMQITKEEVTKEIQELLNSPKALWRIQAKLKDKK